jgi:hypothetical protein
MLTIVAIPAKNQKCRKNLALLPYNSRSKKI